MFIIHSLPPNKREKSVTKEMEKEIKSEINLNSKQATPKKKTSPSKTSKTSMKKEGIKVQTPKKSPSKRQEIKTETKSPPSFENTEKSSEVSESEKPKVNPFFISKKDTKMSVKENAESLSYNPAKSDYHPLNDCFWKHGEK